MADFGLLSIILVYTKFDCRENYYSNAVNSSKNDNHMIHIQRLDMIGSTFFKLSCTQSKDFFGFVVVCSKA